MRKFYFFPAIIFLFSIQFSAFAQKKETVELPMGLRGLMPTVEVMVNGKGPFVFAIDTGAQGDARIDSSLVEKLGLKTSGTIQASDGSGANARTLEMVEVDSITVGGIKFEKITAPTRNYNVSPNVPKIDGILGFNLFAEYLLTLDYPAKKVRIERGELPKENGKDILSFDASRGIPTVELSVGEQKVKTDIDSGNMVGGFILPASVVEKANLASEPIIIGKAKTVVSEIEIKQVVLKDKIRLGGFEFADAAVNFPSLRDGNIGGKILQDFSLTFDQKNKRLKLEKTKSVEENKVIAKIENAKDYTGTYGERTISEENGELFIQRPQGMKLKLKAVSKDEFTLEMLPAARIKFVRDEKGKVVEINVLNPAGVWEKAAKATAK